MQSQFEKCFNSKKYNLNHINQLSISIIFYEEQETKTLSMSSMINVQ